MYTEFVNAIRLLKNFIWSVSSMNKTGNFPSLWYEQSFFENVQIFTKQVKSKKLMHLFV